MDRDHIELVAAIANLRAQLLKAITSGEKEDLRFMVQDIEIELKCLAKKEGTGTVGVGFWVINAEAEGTIGSEKVQTVRLKLKPTIRGEDGKYREVKVSDLDDVL